MVKPVHPHLRVVVDNDLEHLDLCRSNSANAASPVGACVRAFSMSLTDEGASPTSSPISASVNPVERSSEIRDAHLVMSQSLRPAVDISQRPSVTAIRKNGDMPRPPGLPSFASMGPRIKWWREFRKIERRAFAKMINMSYSGLADLENDRSEESKKTHLIAAKLGLNAHYLETDKGEPEAEFSQEPPEQPFKWPFESVPLREVEQLNEIEHSYAESKLLEAYQKIKAERRKTKKS